MRKGLNKAFTRIVKNMLKAQEKTTEAAKKELLALYISGKLATTSPDFSKVRLTPSDYKILKIYPNEEAVKLIFYKHPELRRIGSEEEYLEYIKTIFPLSLSKNIVWTGSDSNFSEGFLSAIRGEGSGAPETRSRSDMFFNGRPADSYLYVEGLNVEPDQHWGRDRYWVAKEILGKPNYFLDEWKFLPWEEAIRLQIPNMQGIFTREFDPITLLYIGRGKLLQEYKAAVGAADMSDKDFFIKILKFKPGESFNSWVVRNGELFNRMLAEYESKGIYPALIDSRNPYVEKGMDTYYLKRGVFDLMLLLGNDVLYGPLTDNEFLSNVTVVLDGGNSNLDKIHWLGTSEDIAQFEEYLKDVRLIKEEEERAAILSNVKRFRSNRPEFSTIVEMPEYVPNQYPVDQSITFNGKLIKFKERGKLVRPAIFRKLFGLEIVRRLKSLGIDTSLTITLKIGNSDRTGTIEELILELSTIPVGLGSANMPSRIGGFYKPGSNYAFASLDPEIELDLFSTIFHEGTMHPTDDILKYEKSSGIYQDISKVYKPITSKAKGEDKHWYEVRATIGEMIRNIYMKLGVKINGHYPISWEEMETIRPEFETYVLNLNEEQLSSELKEIGNAYAYDIIDIMGDSMEKEKEAITKALKEGLIKYPLITGAMSTALLTTTPNTEE